MGIVTNPPTVATATAPGTVIVPTSGNLSIDGSGNITLPSLDAAKITTGTLPLARLSGITTSQLAANAGITSDQIASVAAATITGANTLPDGVLSTNVPLLGASNIFTAAQTITSPAAATKPLIVKGAASQSADLQQWQDSTGAVQLSVSSAGVLSANKTSGSFINFTNGANTMLSITAASPGLTAYGAVITTTGVRVDANQGVYTSAYGGYLPLNGAHGGTPPVEIGPAAAANVPITVKGQASQTADLQQWKDNASAVQLAVTNRGSGGSPIWALKVRAVANSESMAQAHVTLGAYSGKAIEVMDDAGASLGFLALYA